MTNKLLTRSFLHSLGVVAYVLVVAAIMHSAERIFGPMNSVLAAAGFLLLFSVSAAVVGSLIFVYPGMLFLSGQKREGIMMAVATMGWMVLETAIVLGVLLALR